MMRQDESAGTNEADEISINEGTLNKAISKKTTEDED